jgi:hypothetical protein
LPLRQTSDQKEVRPTRREAIPVKLLFMALSLLVAASTFAHGQNPPRTLQEEQRHLQNLIQKLLDEGKAPPQSLQDEQRLLQKLLDEEKALLGPPGPLQCAGIPYMPPPTRQLRHPNPKPKLRPLTALEMRALMCNSPSPRAPELWRWNEPDNSA